MAAGSSGHGPHQDKREATKNTSRDTSLTSKCTDLMCPLAGPAPAGAVVHYLHIWLLSLLLRSSLGEAFTALAVSKR